RSPARAPEGSEWSLRGALRRPRRRRRGKRRRDRGRARARAAQASRGRHGKRRKGFCASRATAPWSVAHKRIRAATSATRIRTPRGCPLTWIQPRPNASRNRLVALRGAPTKVRRGRVLALGHDAEADRARSRKQGEQAVAVLAADHSLQRRQILVEA